MGWSLDRTRQLNTMSLSQLSKPYENVSLNYLQDRLWAGPWTGQGSSTQFQCLMSFKIIWVCLFKLPAGSVVGWSLDRTRQLNTVFHHELKDPLAQMAFRLDFRTNVRYSDNPLKRWFIHQKSWANVQTGEMTGQKNENCKKRKKYIMKYPCFVD